MLTCVSINSKCHNLLIAMPSSKILSRDMLRRMRQGRTVPYQARGSALTGILPTDAPTNQFIGLEKFKEEIVPKCNRLQFSNDGWVTHGSLQCSNYGWVTHGSLQFSNDGWVTHRSLLFSNDGCVTHGRLLFSNDGCVKHRHLQFSYDVLLTHGLQSFNNDG